ncbi:DUF5801 repeats-in-toxin domain-containing protein [Aeromonas encheleia]|uniref:T1SS-143 repeat domain-containing protein n=1 Tax=Aeromonas encheleia TaxID=73010 RepID=UPI000ADE5CEF
MVGGLVSLFNVGGSYGSDGAGTLSGTMSFTGVPLGGLSTNLSATDGGAITLVAVGSGTLNGVDGDGNIVFSIQIVDVGGGVLQLQTTQFEALAHGSDGLFDEALSLLLNQGSLALQYEVIRTDADGDPVRVSDSIVLADGERSVFSFDDDGPTVGLAVEAPGLGTVMVDESLPALGGVGGDGIASATLAAATVQAQFSHSFGSDGAGSISYSLALSGSNVASGLYAVDPQATNGQGAQILLNQAFNIITGSANGVDYFTFTIDPISGAVTLNLLDNVWHGNTSSADDSVSLTLSNGVLTLVQTVTDADGDSAEASLDLGANGTFRFEDDGPIATDEAAQSVAEGTTKLGAFDFVPGADGAGVSHINGIALTFGGDGYSQVVDVGNGVLKVKADGSYSYTADASVDTTNPVTDNLTFTVTDGDGDAVTKAASFNITDANVPTGGSTTAAVDDDGLTGGNPASTTGDLVVAPDPDTNEATFSGTLTFGFGPDGAGSVNFAAMHGTSGTVGQETVNYSWNGANNTLTATGPRGPLFSVVVNPSTGAYTVTLLDNVQHATLDGQPGDNTENDAVTALTYTVKDADNSTTTGTLTITFDDDMPSVGSNLTVQLDDDALANGIPDGPNDDDNAVNTNGILAHNFGADGAGIVQWLTTGAPAGFTYETNAAGSLLVKQGATTVLTVTLNSTTGAYSVTQNAPIQHANADQENNQAFTLNYQVTDGDNDTANGTLAINVDDDTPLAKNDTATVAESSDKDFNVAFVLDSSGSISNSEFTTMMNAVKAAGQALFNGTDGDVKITIVAFSSDPLAYASVTSIAAFNALVDSIIANRPFDDGTDFTAGIQQTMVSYSPIEGWSNQVFFISDGDPNEQLGTGGNSLSDATATAWNTFVDSNAINVTTIGVGDGINTARLQDVDLDGSGAPILVTDFSGLINTLLGQISGNFVSGNVLLGNNNAVGGGDDDSFGADGPGRIMSIKINGTTYAWDGVMDGDQQLTNITTALGGKLTFNFATGAWGYTSPQSVAADTSESFDYVIVDKDGDQASATLTINIEDAAPVIGKVDEDELPGGITDGDAQTTIISGSLVELLVGTSSGQFSLDTTPNVMPSLTSDGVAVTYGFSGSTLTAMAGATTVFTLVVQSNGSYTFTLLGPLDHPNANGDDNEILTLNLTGAIRASDGVNPLPLAGDLLIQVEDDVPTIQASTNLVYSNSSNPGGGTGVFDYSTGADNRGTGPFSSSDSDFNAIGLTGTVGGSAITSQLVTWVSENASTATFDIEFNYAPNPASPGITQEATGTLIFDKINGTYTVSLDEPIEGFSVLKTSASLSITGYASGGSVPDNSQPDVSVAKLDNDFYVQFRSAAEPGGGTGTNNLQTGGVNTNIFANGELFTQAASWVSVSNSANGVAGDTIGKGEVLDLTFHTTNPTGTVVANPDGRAEGIFLKFDGINNEDLVVVLKLIGTGGITTTRALVISNSDIARSGSSAATLAALLAYGITLDNNDGAIVIEHNDYNGVGEDWQIYGAQILTSVEDITTTTALNFNAAFGDTGGSNSTTNFTGQTDSDVVKVSDIGLITSENTTLDAELDFQVGVKDADNDAASNTNLHVTIEAGTTFTGSALADVIQGGEGNDTLSGLAGDDTLIGGLGNDLLIGGTGSDTLTGGAGKDTFKWQAGDAGGTDTIKDFTPGNGGDVLDLSEMLSGEHANAATLDQYLTFASGPGTNKSTLTIDLDGSAGAGTTTHTISFDNVDLTAGKSNLQIIEDLLNQGNLKVDP